MTRMQTISGICVDLVDPRADQIRIEDIAHALSNTCRFNGHVSTFYSVAQHCVHASQWIRNHPTHAKYALAALMHDASEAYLGDVIRPLKVALGDTYKAMEDRLMTLLAFKYGFEYPLPDCVVEIDGVLLATEMRDFCFSVPTWDGKKMEPLEMTLMAWSPATAKRLFMFEFERLTKVTLGPEYHKAMIGYEEAMARINPPEHTRGRDAYLAALELARENGE